MTDRDCELTFGYEATRTLRLSIVVRFVPLLAFALVSCQQLTWEQYMEAAAFAYQDQAFTEAEEMYLAAEAHAHAFPPDDPRLAFTLGNLANFYHSQARDEEAEPLFREALNRLQRVDGPDSPRVARFVADLAIFYTAIDRPEDAEPLYLRALDTLEWELGPYHRDVIVLRTALAGFYQTERRYAEADPLYREVLAILRSSDDADPDQLLTVLDEYAALLRAAGRETEAEPFATEARAIRDAL